MKIHCLFPSFVGIEDLSGPSIDKMNTSLYSSILERAGADGGIDKSNAGGTWHSKYDLSEWCEGLVDLLAHIRTGAIRMAGYYGAEPGGKLNLNIIPWAMVSAGDGAYAVPHTHPRCQISGVYYVATGEPNPDFTYSGKIELFNPTGYGHCSVPGMRGWHRREIIPPKPGRMLMFPAELLHMVHPFRGTGYRVAVAFNIHIRGYTPPEKKDEGELT